MPIQGQPVTCSSCGQLIARIERGEVIHKAGGYVVWSPRAIACKCTAVTYTADLGASGAVGLR
jgi:hypothetical protein